MAPRSGSPARRTDTSRDSCDFSGILNFPAFSPPAPLSLLATRVGESFRGNVLSQRHVLGLRLSGLPQSRYNQANRDWTLGPESMLATHLNRYVVRSTMRYAD